MPFLPREGHIRRLEEYQIAALALCPWSQAANVRNGSKADIEACPRDVRFTPKSGHRLAGWQCPLCAKSRHAVITRSVSEPFTMILVDQADALMDVPISIELNGFGHVDPPPPADSPAGHVEEAYKRNAIERAQKLLKD
jgi:hypothetical protein